MGKLLAQVVRSENPEDWAPIFERATFQVAYRQLGMVSLYCPVDVAFSAIKILEDKGIGKLKVLLENRIAVWEDVPIEKAIRINIYVFGSPTRRKNTVLARMGWWKMYFFEAGMRVLDASIVGRLLALVTTVKEKKAGED
ncbi:MAG: hypothetical protein QW356_04650 [Candidatus Hadarchaeales archaeon]